MITHLLMDETNENRVGGAVGFNMRTGDYYVFKSKTVIVAAGGASHIFKPRAVGEGWEELGMRLGAMDLHTFANSSWSQDDTNGK